MFAELASPRVDSHASTFTRPDVMRAVASRMVDGADVELIDRLADMFLCSAAPSPSARSRVSRPGRPENSWPSNTTSSPAPTPAATIRLGSPGGPRWPPPSRARPSISDEQADMVAELCLSGRGIDVVVGAAGTGKTYALDTARDGWQRSGLTVHGAALSARAAAELQAGSHIESMTVALLLARIELGRLALDRRSVVVVDEAGMVGTRTLDRLHQVTDKAGAKLVLVGDPEQLPEIEAGGAFRALTQRPDTIHLVENRRQTQLWERQALHHLRTGQIGDAVEAYDRRQRIVMVADPDTLRDRVVADWFASTRAGERALMIAVHRSEVRDLNDRARQLLDAAGQLGARRLVVGSTSSPKGTGSWPSAATTTTSTSSTATSAPSPTSTPTAPSPSAATAPATTGPCPSNASRTGCSTTATPAPTTKPKAPPSTAPSPSATTATSTAKPPTPPCPEDASRTASTSSNPTPTSTRAISKARQASRHTDQRDLRRRHTEHELSRDRRQDLATRLLANLPEPDPQPHEPDQPGIHRERPDPAAASTTTTESTCSSLTPHRATGCPIRPPKRSRPPPPPRAHSQPRTASSSTGSLIASNASANPSNAADPGRSRGSQPPARP